MTNDQLMKAAWMEISRRWTKQDICVVCGTRDWKMAGSPLFMSSSLRSAEDQPLGLAFIVITCVGCGQSLFFSVSELGLA